MQKQILANKRRTVHIIIAFTLIISLFGALISALSKNWSITLIFAIAALAYAIFQYYFSASFSTLVSGARPIAASDEPKLYHMVNNVANLAKVPVPKIYLIDDPAPNAFATGRDPNHSLVAVTTGLLKVMPDAELKAVLAHEISHIKNYDIRVSMIAFGLTSIAGVFSDLGFRLIYFGAWNRSKNGEERSPIGVVALILAAIAAPFVAALAQMAVSREREFLADVSAANLINTPDPMISALKNLADHSRPMQQQNTATEALFISSPLRKSIFSGLFSTHPPLEKRIERLERLKK